VLVLRAVIIDGGLRAILWPSNVTSPHYGSVSISSIGSSSGSASRSRHSCCSSSVVGQQSTEMVVMTDDDDDDDAP